MDILRTISVIFGIGLVIFVHEGGHFIAARMCKVRVDVFSLGFGPKLFGFKKGATLYQVAAIPIGGYVKMAGEVPDGSGRPPRGDELWSKGVWQRFFIYSGGVLMNVVFALVCFPLVFSSGVPITPPVIGTPTKGQPAWYAGLESGTEIVAVEGEAMFDFTNIYTAVALADPGPLEFTVRPPGSKDLRTIHIEPEKNDDFRIYMIGVEVGLDPELKLTVGKDGPARTAGLRTGDVLAGVVGGHAFDGPLIQLARAFQSGDSFTLIVSRDGEPDDLEIPIVPEERKSGVHRFGFSPLQNQVQGMRANPDLAALGLVHGDRILRIGERAVSRSTDLLEGLLATKDAATLKVQAPDGSVREVTFPRALSAAQAAQVDSDLFLTFDPESTLVEIAPDQAAARAGLRTGDRLTSMDGRSAGSWEGLFDLAQTKSKRTELVTIEYERKDENGVWTAGSLEVAPSEVIVKAYGFNVLPVRTTFRTDSVGASIEQGFAASKRFLQDVWLTLKKMALGRVGTNNVGGIITISRVSYSWASEGWEKFFYFLCILSINLAFLNVLPIPVLDGGHLFFCLVEAVKGSPVSERTLGYSQVVGLVVILTLMVYVTYQDVLRIL